MKKVLLLLFLFFLSTICNAQNKKTYKVGILLDQQTEELQPLLIQLQDEIKAVVGEDAIIEFPQQNILSNNFNLRNAESNYRTLLSNNTDIILAFGVLSSVVMSKQNIHEKPTILFGTVNVDFSPIKKSNEISGVHNFTYLVAPQSFNKDLSTFKELSDFKQVGIAVDESLLKMLPFKEAFDAKAKELEIGYKMIPFKTVEDIVANINSAIDAFYLAGGFFLNSDDISQIAVKLISHKIPSFTSTNIEDVKLGLMATNQTEENINLFNRRIALTVEAIVNGKELSQLPTYIKYNNKLTLNFNTVESVGIPIKFSMITTTNLVGEFKNVLSQKKYNLLDVMQQVIVENLSLQSAQKNIELNQQNVKTAKSNYLPSVAVSATGVYIDPELAKISGGQNPEYSTAGNIAVSQVLFSESANANISVQRNLLKAQEEDFNSAVLDAIFNASNLYFNALILKANLQIQKQNLELTKKNLEIADQNFEAGQSGKADVLRFRSQLAQNTQSLVEAINLLEKSFYALNQILNNPINHELDVEEAELSKGLFEAYDYQRLRRMIDDPKLRKPFIEFLIQEAKINAPELKTINYNILATNRNIKLNSSGRFLPTLALQGQYNHNFNQWGKGSTPEPILNTNYTIGLNFSLPIFRQNQYNINRQTAVIQKDQLEITKENLELNIASNINNAILNIVNEIANIELSKISESAALEGVELTQAAYSNGAINIVQLIDTQNNYLQAQLSRITAGYNYLINSIQLERFIGYYFLLHTKEQNQEFIQRFFNNLQNKN